MDVTSIITCLLIEVLSFVNGPDLPEKSNLNLPGNTEDKEEIGKQLQEMQWATSPPWGTLIGQIALCFYFLKKIIRKGFKEKRDREGNWRLKILRDIFTNHNIWTLIWILIQVSKIVSQLGTFEGWTDDCKESLVSFSKVWWEIFSLI